MFGFEYEDAIGKFLYDLIVTEQYYDDFKDLFNEELHDDSLIFQSPLELYAKTIDGATLPIEMHLRPVKSNNLNSSDNISFHSETPVSEIHSSNLQTLHPKQLLIAVFIRNVAEKIAINEEMSRLIEELQVSRDIIEQNAGEFIELNLKLSESEELLKELNASKDKFFSIIAHDLKGPFLGLLGSSELLSSDIESLSNEEIKAISTTLNNSAQKLFKLLENLLEWSRIQRGAIEFNPSEIELENIISTNIDLASINAKNKNISIEMSLEPQLKVFADSNMLNTILRNLLSNAVKFTNSGGKIEIKARNLDDDYIEITVADNGVGMDDNALNSIFRIDKSYSTPGTNQEQGTGLGLILCKDLIAKNNGTICVESQPGIGTTFTLKLKKFN
jgi:signal transduction histidine kinase